MDIARLAYDSQDPATEYFEDTGKNIDMILDEDLNCPFLNEQGLCRMILKYGDRILSETCSMFPPGD